MVKGKKDLFVGQRISDDPEPVHLFFGLSYAHYLVLPRSVLQSMPKDWQKKFVACLEELGEKYPNVPAEGNYRVRLIVDGKQVPIGRDEFCEYDRGRRFVEPSKLSRNGKENR